jgi:hypothetical protein
MKSLYADNSASIDNDSYDYYQSIVVKAQIDQQIRDRTIPDELISHHQISSLMSRFDH